MDLNVITAPKPNVVCCVGIHASGYNIERAFSYTFSYFASVEGKRLGSREIIPSRTNEKAGGFFDRAIEEKGEGFSLGHSNRPVITRT